MIVKERNPITDLKILRYCPYPLDIRTPDGVKDVARGLTNYLRKHGARVRLVGPYIEDEKNNAADYTFLKPLSLSGIDTHSNVSIALLPFAKWYASNIHKTVREDVLVVDEPIFDHTILAAAKMNGKLIPAVIGIHHSHWDKLDRKTKLALLVMKYIRRPEVESYGKLTNGPFKNIMSWLDGRIAVSQDSADSWNELYPAEFEIIPNGIDTRNEFFPNDVDKIEKWNDGRATIFFAGRHDERKGIDDLIRACNLLIKAGKKVKLKIAGEGAMTANLKILARSLQLSEDDVEFLGVLPKEELVRAYRSADIFISYANGGESFGLTNVQALACGTVVIGGDIGGYRRVIGGKEFAWTPPPRQPKALASTISEVLDIPLHKRKDLGRQGRDYVVSNYDWDIVAEKHIDYYDRVISKKGRPKKEDWPKKRRGKIRKFVFQKAKDGLKEVQKVPKLVSRGIIYNRRAD